ncbi:hypothetical protein ACLOJK_010599 [Asimina triloba]
MSSVKFVGSLQKMSLAWKMTDFWKTGTTGGHQASMEAGHRSGVDVGRGITFEMKHGRMRLVHLSGMPDV